MKNLITDPWLSFITKKGIEEIPLSELFKRNDIIEIGERDVFRKYLAYSFLLSLSNTFFITKRKYKEEYLLHSQDFSILSEILVENSKYFDFSDENSFEKDFFFQPKISEELENIYLKKHNLSKEENKVYDSLFFPQQELIAFNFSQNAVNPKKGNLKHFGFEDKTTFSFKDSVFHLLYFMFGNFPIGSAGKNTNLYPSFQRVIFILEDNNEFNFGLKILNNTLCLEDFLEKFKGYKISEYSEKNNFILFDDLSSIFNPYSQKTLTYKEKENVLNFFQKETLNCLFHFWAIPVKKIRFIEENGKYSIIYREKNNYYVLPEEIKNPYVLFKIEETSAKAQSEDKSKKKFIRKYKKKTIKSNSLDLFEDILSWSAEDISFLPISLINGNNIVNNISIYGLNADKGSTPSLHIEKHLSLDLFYKTNVFNNKKELLYFFKFLKEELKKITIKNGKGSSFKILNLRNILFELDIYNYELYEIKLRKILYNNEIYSEQEISKDEIFNYLKILEKIELNSEEGGALAYKIRKIKEVVALITKINNNLKSFKYLESKHIINDDDEEYEEE